MTRNLRQLEGVFRWLSRLIAVGFAYGMGIGLLGLCVATAGGIWYLDSLMEEMPAPEELQMERPSETTKIYASGGEVLGEFFLENRRFTPIEEIPDILQKAFLAIEDTDFYTHRGVRFESLVRAAIALQETGRMNQGGSTITMQITRDLFLSQKKTFDRKIREIVLALMLEQRYSKDEILEMYLNKIYFGEYAYGVYTAAQNYFGKDLKDLSTAEAAFLAGVVQAPSRHSAYRSVDRATKRRNLVLDRMLSVGFINEEEHRQAAAEPFKLRYEGHPPAPTLERLTYPHFTTYVLKQLLDTYGKEMVYGGGLKVYTTLDVTKQKLAEDALKKGIEEYGKQHKVTEGALVALEPGTGYIVAMVGGTDFKNSKFNRATQARRHAGSSFKPVVYSTACESGYNLSTQVQDAPLKIPMPGGKFYSPRNSNREYKGFISLRQALIGSVNVVAVKVADALGTDKIIQMARRFGITAPLHPGLSMALGANEMVPLEIAAAFAVFPQQGVYVKPTAITKVIDRSGRVLYSPEKPERRRAISERCAYALTSAMMDVINKGTARRARVTGHQVAGKTGTTSDFKDAWFSGFSPQLVATVWVGNDSGEPMHRVFGGTVPAPIWQTFMSGALKDQPAQEFTKPSSITQADLGFGQGKQLGIVSAQKEEELIIEDAYVSPSFFDDYVEPMDDDFDPVPVEPLYPAPGPVPPGAYGVPTPSPMPSPPAPSRGPMVGEPEEYGLPSPRTTVPMVDFEEDDGASF